MEVVKLNQNEVISLPHLPKEVLVGARKTKLCAYSVALEGWRRGLTLKWYTKDSDKFDHMITFGVNPPGRLFSLSSKDRTHYFFRTRGDKVTKQAVEIGSDKDETKIWLSRAKVPTPMGKRFTEESVDEEIINFSNTIDFPLVLKPTNGSLGNGVVTNIKDVKELKNAIKYVREELGYPDVILERFATGEEYRVYVIEDKVVAAYNRIPANVVGDGVHTIRELISLKNRQRKKNARLHDCLITIDKETTEFLSKSGYTLKSIPSKGTFVLLQEKTNVSAGGDPIDATDQLRDEIKQIAIDSVKAIPGLYHGGVDIIWDKTKPIERAAVVIELNPTAQIGGILFPVEGQARDIPSAIIDYYFPETVNLPKSQAYFDLTNVLEPLQNRSALEVELPKAPIGELYSKKLILMGDVTNLSFHRQIKREAINRGLYGHIDNLFEGQIEVVVSGTNEKVLAEFIDVISNKTNHANITEVIEQDWNLAVKIGFNVSKEVNVRNLKSVETNLKAIEKELDRLKKVKRKLDYEKVKLQQSRSWRYTSIIRKIGTKVKGKRRAVPEYTV
ncbi:Cyanophycin synthetase [Sutcliffiella horikoshii]|uniref:Acylphosphatase n=1 Tax=Sutcliffiella horikoshii TaxID=79883 RepID=A0ABM6KNL3_9BACI|nr:Cyanophycin synthetase [Sutcliffiella horikoshii]